MIVNSLLAVGFVMSIVAVLFVICAIILVLVILIQKGKGGGLSGAIAGGLASGLLGSKTGDFLTWFTIALVGLFLGLSLVMAKFYKPKISDFGSSPAAGQQSAETAKQSMPVEGSIEGDANSF